MKKIKNIAILLGAMAFATTACTNSDNEPNYGEITLTTPVVTLDDVKATVSRADGPNYSAMDLHVDLLKASDDAVSRSATYTYRSSWSCTGENNSPLVVTGGAGNYHARAWAKVNLAAVTGDNPVPAITGAIYATPASAKMGVADDGTFTFVGDNALTPKTAAIVLNVTDADNVSVNDYTVSYSLSRINEYSWSGTSATSDNEDTSNGNFAPVTISEDTQIMTITIGGGVSYSVNTNNLSLEAGKVYTFNVKLGGNTQINLGANSVTVSGFTKADETIDVGR